MLGAALAACLGGTGLAATACSSSGASSSGGLPSVQIINTSATGALAIEQLLTQLGYFQHFGVDVKTTNVESGSQVFAALASGSGDVTMLSGLIGAFPAIEKGLPLKVLAGTEVVSTSAIFTGDPSVQSVKDLAGKTIGVGSVGSELYDVFTALLSKYGISQSQVTFQNVGSSADSFKAVLAKQIDCGYGQVGDEADAKSKGCRMIATVNGELPKWINQGAVTSTSALQGKRASLIRVMAAYAKLFGYLSTPQSKSKYVAAYVASGGSAAAGELEWQFVHQNKAYSPTLALPQDKLDFLQEQNVKNGTQKSVLPYSSYTDLGLVSDAVTMSAK